MIISGIIASRIYAIATGNSYYGANRSTFPFSYWRLGEPSGSAVDEIFSNSLAVTGTPTYSETGALVGDVDTAFSFDGTSGNYFTSASIDEITPSTDQIVIKAWLNWTDTTSGMVPVSLGNGDAASNQALDVVVNGAATGGISVSHNGTTIDSSSTTFNDGSWHLVVATLDGTTMTLYVDGEQEAQNVSVTRSSDTNPTFLRIGAEYQTEANNYNGSIDEVDLMRLPVDATIAKRLYLIGGGSKDNYKTLGLSKTPLGYWPLSESSGTTTTDVSGYGNTGNIIGSVELGSDPLLANDTSTSFVFDTTGERVEVPSFWDGNGDFTISIVLKTTYTGGREVLWQSSNPSVSPAGVLFIYLNTGSGYVFSLGRLAIAMDTPSGHLAFTTNAYNYYDGEPHIITWGRSGSTPIITLDGVNLPLTGSLTSAQAHNGGNVRFSHSSVPYFGNMSNYAFYDRALSAEEIIDQYAVGKHGPNTYAYLAHKLDPIGYWRLGESSGNAVDETGHNYDLTVTGTPTYSETGAVTGDTDTAVSFDGTTGDYFTSGSIAGILPSTSAISIVAWVKWTDTTAGLVPICIANGNADANAALVLSVNGGSAGDISLEHNGTTINSSTTTFNDGSWHLAVGAINGTNMTLYVDDAQEANNASVTRSANASATFVRVGAEYQTEANNFNGYIDECGVYAVELVVEEIKALYGTGLTYSEKLLSLIPSAYYRLGEASGTTMVDSSGNGYDGTYVNTPTLGVTGLINDTDTAVTFASASSERGTVTSNTDLEPGAGDFSCALWFNAADADQFGAMVNKVQSVAPSVGWAMAAGNSFSGAVAKYLSFYFRDGGNYRIVRTTNNIIDGGTHFVVVTWDVSSNTGLIYVDGTSVSLTALGTVGTVVNVTNTEAFNIAGANAVGQYFNGTLDEVSLFNYILTPADILSLYNRGL